MKIFDLIKNKTGLSNVKVKNVRSKVFSLTAIVGLSVLSLSYQNCAKKMSTKLVGSSTQASTVSGAANTDQNGGGDISNNTNNYNSGGSGTYSGVNNAGSSGSNSGSSGSSTGSTTSSGTTGYGTTNSGGITAGSSGNTSSNVVLAAGACLFQNKSVTNSATVVGYTQDQAADGGCSQYEVHYRCNNGTLEKINPTYYGTNTSGATYVGSPNNLKLSCKQSASMSCTGWRNADGTYELDGKFIPASADKGKEGYYFIAAVHQGSVYAIRLDLAGFFSVPNINAMPGFASPTQINSFDATLISSANVNNYFHNATLDKVPRSIDEIAVRTTEANLFSKENTYSKGRIGFTSDPAVNVETKVHMKTSAELSSFSGAAFYLGYSIGAKSDDSILEPKLQKKILCAIVP
jgi:hypothetical protein